MPAQVPRAPPRADALARTAVGLREADRGRRGVGAVATEGLRDAPRAVGVVERELAEDAGAEDCDVLPMRARRDDDRIQVQQRADVDVCEPHRGGDEQSRSVRRREDEGLDARRARDLARRVAEVEPGDRFEAPLACQHRGAFGLGERARLVDLGAAEDAAVSGGERLRHRRRRAQDVDDDPDRRGGLLTRREGDMYEHGRS